MAIKKPSFDDMLAKIKEAFELFKEDPVAGQLAYLLVYRVALRTKTKFDEKLMRYVGEHFYNIPERCFNKDYKPW